MAPVKRRPRATRLTTLKGGRGGAGGGSASPAKVNPAHKMTQKQFAAYLKYIKSHHLGIYSKTPRKAIRPAGECDWEFPAKTYWVLGGNDTLDTCALTAFANLLLLEHRVKIPDDMIAQTPEGLSLTEAVAWLEDHGMCGWGVKNVTVLDPGPQALLLPGVVLGLETPWGPHAAVTMGGGQIITWGRILRVKPPMMLQEALHLEWEHKETVDARSWLSSFRA